MKRQIFAIAVGISAIFMVNSLTAGEKALIKWGPDAETLQQQWVGNVKFETMDGKLCAIVEDGKQVRSKDFIPVEAGKKYTLTGTFKSLGDEPSKLYYGFLCYDNNKKDIFSLHANAITGTATELIQECKKGDKTLLVKANDKWKINNAVAFNAKDDFSDLPNRELAYKITQIVPKGENMELQLSAGVLKEYPAGTKIRMHSPSYGSYIYTAVCGAKIPADWKSYTESAVIAKPGQMGWKFLRPGTAFIKVVILPNYSKKKDEKIAFTDLTLTESE